MLAMVRGQELYATLYTVADRKWSSPDLNQHSEMACRHCNQQHNLLYHSADSTQILVVIHAQQEAEKELDNKPHSLTITKSECRMWVYTFFYTTEL